jgi:hypothetical protein
VSIQVPIRLKITQNGATVGYVETLDLVSGITAAVTGPIAKLTATGVNPGGGDAATLGGHPPSFFGTAAEDAILTADVLALQAQDAVTDQEIAALNTSLASLLSRPAMWARLGVAVQSTPPASGITYAQWLAGNAGTWGWINIP